MPYRIFSLTTDIIVGFPGETEEDFQDTLDVVEKCDFDSAFTFIYSQKKRHTCCPKMENQVPEDVVKRPLLTVFLLWFRKKAERLLPVSRELFRKSL